MWAIAHVWRSEDSLKKQVRCLPCGCRGLSSGHPALHQTPLPTELALFISLFLLHGSCSPGWPQTYLVVLVRGCLGPLTCLLKPTKCWNYRCAPHTIPCLLVSPRVPGAEQVMPSGTHEGELEPPPKGLACSQIFLNTSREPPVTEALSLKWLCFPEHSFPHREEPLPVGGSPHLAPLSTQKI